MQWDIKLTLQSQKFEGFTHNGIPMSTAAVKAVLEYGLEKGYTLTGQLPDDEIDAIIKNMGEQTIEREKEPPCSIGKILEDLQRDSCKIARYFANETMSEKEYFDAGAKIYNDALAKIRALPLPTIKEQRLAYLEALISNPEIENFLEGVRIEAAHQTERHGAEQEESKYPHDYALVQDKLKGKQAVAIWDKDAEKYKHHLITMAAACYNAHRQVAKEGTVMNKFFISK